MFFCVEFPSDVLSHLPQTPTFGAYSGDVPRLSDFVEENIRRGLNLLIKLTGENDGNLCLVRYRFQVDTDVFQSLLTGRERFFRVGVDVLKIVDEYSPDIVLRLCEELDRPTEFRGIRFCVFDEDSSRLDVLTEKQVFPPVELGNGVRIEIPCPLTFEIFVDEDSIRPPIPAHHQVEVVQIDVQEISDDCVGVLLIGQEDEPLVGIQPRNIQEEVHQEECFSVSCGSRYLCEFSRREEEFLRVPTLTLDDISCQEGRRSVLSSLDDCGLCRRNEETPDAGHLILVRSLDRRN